MTTIGAALLGGAWLWDTFGAKVAEQAGKVGAGAGLQVWKKINWKTSAERYRGEMQRLYGTMRIIGMAEPVALADIFTDVFLLDKPSAWQRHNIEELQRLVQLEPETIHRREERRAGLDLVQSHERLLILGKPGAGKTTLLKHLVLQCTTGTLDAVPIFVGLKDWADSGLALMPFLARQFTICAFPDAQPFIEHLLEEGRALVLFDGLDEVNLEQGMRERINHEVRDFADQYPRSRCVITCRTAASDYQFERFAYCELADFTVEQMRTFVAQWFQRDEAKRTAFLAEFAKDANDRLRDLARTPLLLTLLCLTFDATMTFPARRAEIYEEAIDALLKKWDASRSIKRDTAYRMLSLGHKRQMLSRIAAETFSKNTLFMSQAALAGQIVTYLQPLPKADVGEEIDGEAILRAIEAQHGLLIERAQRIYSFSHLTFHEYFAALYIKEHPSQQMFRSVIDHAHDARWREVLLLTASMVDDDNAETFFKAFDTALIERIQADPVLLSLFQWIARKTENVTPAHRAATYKTYLMLVLIEQTGSDLLDSGALDRDLARDLARDLNRTLAIGHARDLNRAIARALAIGRALDLDLDLDLARARALDRARVHIDVHRLPQATIAALHAEFVLLGFLLWVHVMASSASDTSNAADYPELLFIWQQQSSSATPALHVALIKLTFPAPTAPTAQWQQLAIDLRAALVAHLDIGHTWALETAPLESLADYLTASNRMLECLDLAAVADRDAIRNRLLLPPQP